jgi:Family of unknown function (DUF6502)
MCKTHIYTELMDERNRSNRPDPVEAPGASHGPGAPADASAAVLSAGAASADARALQSALARILEPVAQLSVARGLPCPAVEEQLRRAFVLAASRAHAQLPAHRRVSRIAAATGLTRREVSRLTQPADVEAPARRPLANEVFARWLTDPELRDARGQPRDLPRSGPAPSFETLAQSVTRDVHPRTLLDELLRLRLAALDADGERVSLVRDAFVPREDGTRMLELLRDNTGDHLAAAVANVLGRGSEHLEQAVFADELSPESIATIRRLIQSEWQALLGRVVPALETLIEEDARLRRPQDQRVRIGIYSYTTKDGSPE